MSEVSFLRDLSFVWLSALVAGFIFRQMKQPMITGYILAGLLIGPYFLKLIDSKVHVTDLAELGVALLLFTLGVELSLKQIFSANKRVFLVGITQVVLTVLFGFCAAQALGFATGAAGALLLGAVCALSSTVVVTKVLGDRGELSSLHGSILVGVLIVQDLALVPIISLLTALNSGAENIAAGLFLAALKACFLIGIVVIGATRLVPPFLGKAARTGSRELFQLAVMSICLLTAILSNSLGMSVELGAFLAGIMVSESVYGYQALADIHPMKDLFSTIFFVTVGMMLNPQFVLSNWSLILIFVLVLLVVKVFIAALSARLAVRETRTALLVGMGLAQIGEFSFVLAMLGKSLGIVDGALYDLYISASVITLVLSPFILAIAPVLLAARDEKEVLQAGEDSHRKVEMEGHVVLCGFGTSGHGLAHVLAQYSIPFVVIEFNAVLLDELDAAGYRYVYGDAAKGIILESAAIASARALVVSVRDHLTATTIVDNALKLNPDLKVIVRSADFGHIESLKAVGVHAVVNPEIEAGMELTRQTLLGLEVNIPEIKAALDDFDKRRYSIFKPEVGATALQTPFSDAEDLTVWMKINDESMVGRSIADIEFRKQTGCTVVAVKRDGKQTTYPEPEFVLEKGDAICIVGKHGHLEKAESTFDMARFTPINLFDSESIHGDSVKAE